MNLNLPEGSQVQGHERDVAALIGVLAVLEGHLRRGLLDDEIIHDLTLRLVDEDLLAPDAVGGPPSAGRVSIAINNINHRLRFFLGEYDSEPQPLPVATMFVMQFSNEAQAVEYVGQLPGDALNVLREEQEGLWLVSAVYPEVAPDPAFKVREITLSTIARGFDGRFVGTQDPPLD